MPVTKPAAPLAGGGRRRLQSATLSLCQWGWVHATGRCHFLQFGVLVLPLRRRTLVVLDWQRRGVQQSRRHVEHEDGDSDLSVRVIAMAKDVAKLCLRVSRSFCLVVWMARHGLGYPF